MKINCSSLLSPNSRYAILFFTGIASAAHETHTGGGTNYQCLPLNPQFDGYSHSGGYYSWMYGTEYQTPGSASTIPSGAGNQNVPCARCYSRRSAVLMIPAHRSCPSGWTHEYRGRYYVNYNSSSLFYICYAVIPGLLSNISPKAYIYTSILDLYQSIIGSD